MKRFLTALLAIVYFTITSGVVVNTHYCMGRKSAVKLQALAPAACKCGKKSESKKGCCKTELKVVKVEDAQKMPATTEAPGLFAALMARPLSLMQLPPVSQMAVQASVAHSPPLLSSQDTYLRNRVFRI